VQAKWLICSANRQRLTTRPSFLSALRACPPDCQIGPGLKRVCFGRFEQIRRGVSHRVCRERDQCQSFGGFLFHFSPPLLHAGLGHSGRPWTGAKRPSLTSAKVCPFKGREMASPPQVNIFPNDEKIANIRRNRKWGIKFHGAKHDAGIFSAANDGRA